MRDAMDGTLGLLCAADRRRSSPSSAVTMSRASQTADRCRDGQGDVEFDEFESGPSDPWEGFNRKIFWFNEKLDIYFLRPVAIGWDFVMPDLVQTGTPERLLECPLPGHLRERPAAGQAGPGLRRPGAFPGQHDRRHRRPLGSGEEDRTAGKQRGFRPDPRLLGQFRPGPTWCCPSWGPRARATPSASRGFRDHAVPYFIAWYVSAAITATNVVNTRAHYIEEIDENRQDGARLLLLPAQRLRELPREPRQ